MKQLHFPHLFELVSRWYVFIFLNIYGLGKIMGGQFYRRGELPEEIALLPIGQASGFDIAWTFMGYSSLYIFFVGSSQILGACLLLWERTKLLGVAILVPIMVNVVVFDIIFLEPKGALVNASLYLLMLLYILFFNRKRVTQAIKALTTPSVREPEARKSKLIRVGTVLLIMAVLFVIDQFFVTFVGH